jgi:hypothetical protein
MPQYDFGENSGRQGGQVLLGSIAGVQDGGAESSTRKRDSVSCERESPLAPKSGSHFENGHYP